MNTQFYAGTLCVIATVFQVGCSTTQGLGPPNLDKSQQATIQVVTKIGSGAGARYSHIVSIDGKSVGDGATHVTVEPGLLYVSFDFRQVIDPGGGFGISVNINGNERDVSEPQE